MFQVTDWTHHYGRFFQQGVVSIADLVPCLSGRSPRWCLMSSFKASVPGRRLQTRRTWSRSGVSRIEPARPAWSCRRAATTTTLKRFPAVQVHRLGYSIRMSPPSHRRFQRKMATELHLPETAWRRSRCTLGGESTGSNGAAWWGEQQAVRSRWGRQAPRCSRSPCCSCREQTLMPSLNNSDLCCTAEIKLKSDYAS